MTSRGLLNRRAALRAAALAAVAVPVAGTASACTGYDDSPDPLLPLLARARADAAAARGLARSSPEAENLASQVATVRSAQADALGREVDRLNRPRPDRTNAPGTTVADLDALRQRLADARQQAAALVPGLPAYRAGLVGAVAAGCAGAQQLDPALGAGQPGPLGRVSTGQLEEPAVEALQGALAAEHAAVWVYGLVSAFLPDAFGKGLDAGAEAHRDRRSACERVLTAAGAEPRGPEPAYLPPQPVTDETSAATLVVTAETDAARAWHGVLERTEDTGLRELATQALVGSATRCTSWRLEAGLEPAAIALPGRG
ncbi:ferritin-like domain-containing protein [Prauserella oleivorans]|uniref:Ferritin-like domain-containing protein n=1 Tax=Prauserella oleivorans TaxID=1478153 RepID=A0ABW5W9I4_9PSEU